MTTILTRRPAWWRRWGVPAWPGSIAILALAAVTLKTAPSASIPVRPLIHRSDSLARIRPTRARVLFESGLDTLAFRLDALGRALDSRHDAQAVAAFRTARSGYKRIEALLAVYSPPTAALLNGPLPEESEDRPTGPLGAPAGFQIVEAALFGHETPGADSVSRTVAAMANAVRQFSPLTSYLKVSDAEVLDAARLEVARVATLGLAGFDSDRSGDAVSEGAEALHGTATLIRQSSAGTEAADTLDRAANYLAAHASFSALDRLEAITGYLEPAARSIHRSRLSLAEPVPALHQLWRSTRGSLFESGALDPAAYAPTFAPRSSPALVALGRQLFFEPRLSGPQTRSCAFCHQPASGFTDGRRVSIPLPGTRPAHPRNTPTLLNAAFEPTLFADSRVGSLEAQVETVIASPAEMGGSLDSAARRLAGDPVYRAAFADAFRDRGDSTVNPRSLRFALAAFVRSLNGLDSRFDRALRGDTTALSSDERRGFTLFMGKARCGTCHFLPLMNGTMPTDFATSEPEIIGVPARAMMSGATLDADLGRGGFDHQPPHQAAFKVPTLRNVALTAPYMHNGVFATLEQVVDFYERGGGRGIGARVAGQTLPVRPLHLTMRERKELVAFLGSLTDSGATPGESTVALRSR